MTIHFTMCQTVFVYEHNNTVRWVVIQPHSADRETEAHSEVTGLGHTASKNRREAQTEALGLEFYERENASHEGFHWQRQIFPLIINFLLFTQVSRPFPMESSPKHSDSSAMGNPSPRE